MNETPYGARWLELETSGTKRSRRIAPFVFVAAVVLLALLGGAIAVGTYYWKRQPVHLVNGTPIAYAIEINGERVELPPMSVTKYTAGTGTSEIRIVSGPDSGDSFTVTLDTNPFERIFDKTVTIINPDQTAVIEFEESGYYDDRTLQTMETDPRHRVDYHYGERVRTFQDIDFIFEALPEEVSLASTSKWETRSRVGLSEYGPAPQVAYIVEYDTDKSTAVSYCQSALKYWPDNATLIGALHSAMGDDAFMTWAEPLLERRPVEVELHRAWQIAATETIEKSQLRERYISMLGKEPDDPALMYLAGRMMEGRELEEHFLKSAEHPAMKNPRPREWLVMMNMCRANFGEALHHAKALQQMFDEPYVEYVNYQLSCEMALGLHADALATCRTAIRLSEESLYFREMEVSLLHSLGRTSEIDPAINKYIKTLRDAEYDPAYCNEYRRFLDAYVHFVNKNPTAATQLLSESEDPTDQFYAAAMSGDAAAARKIYYDNEDLMDSVDTLVMTVLAQSAGDEIRAARLAADVLAGFDECESIDCETLRTWLEGDPVGANIDELLDVTWYPMDKAILLTYVGLRYPEHRAACFELAKKLNTHKLFFAAILDGVFEANK